MSSETTPSDRQAGSLAAAMASPGGAEALREWLRQRVAGLVAASPSAIKADERFNRYGLTSLLAASLIADLSRELSRLIPPTLVWDHPTINAVVRYLTEGPAASEAAPAAGPRGLEAGEEIAIVGLACRFPGGADARQYWQSLVAGKDSVIEVPESRFSLARHYHPDVSVPGKMSTRWSGLLDDVRGFDAAFFGISPREAKEMDPQQRLVMELAWEAFEDAGITPAELRSSRTGVFMGSMWSDYARLTEGRPESITQYTATGTDISIASARVNYFFGLAGPALTVNTACSSSLVAIHLACQSLRSGDSQLALAGGVSLIVSPASTISMSKFGAMAPDGRSKAFDARANGYVRGEGAGVVVLKPLSAALADGDFLYCVIKAAGINNDGYSNGLTAPNPEAQAAMLREAYARAGVGHNDVHYVETHGTGTMLGDPIEAGALGSVLGRGRPSDRPLKIGSVKTNIGHLEAAAGMAGLIKTCLAMCHRTLPPTLHFQSPNPHVRFAELGLSVVDRLEPWPGEGEPALAGVSSFGFGGTNCHLVLAEAPAASALLLPLAAQAPEGLREAALEARKRLAESRPLEVCRQAAATLEASAVHRLAVVAASRQGLDEALSGYLEGEERPDVIAGTAQRRRTLFFFGGQGGQWRGMGRRLLEAEPAFRRAVADCEAAFAGLLDFSLEEVLRAGGPEGREETVEVVQPLVFTMEVALARLLGHYGIEPDAVVGQSLGEAAAAHVAGLLSLEDAALVVRHRSRLMMRTSGQGGMAMVKVGEAEMKRLLAELGSDELSIAGVLSPASTVVGGSVPVLEAALARWAAEGVESRRVRVDIASHTHQMEPLCAELAAAIAGIRPLSPRLPYFPMLESRSGECVRATDPDYWVKNLRQAFYLPQAFEAALAEGPAVLVELGPGPVLLAALESCLGERKADTPRVATLRRDEDGPLAMLECVGRLFVAGVEPRWREVLPEPRLARAALAPEGQGAASSGEEAPELVVLSARSAESLRAQAGRWAEYLAAHAQLGLADLSFTSRAHRALFDHRLTLVPRSRAELAASLGEFASSQALPAGAELGRAARVPDRPPVFLYSGQGSQWAGMALDLARREPRFAEALRACERLFSELGSGWSLLAELGAGAEASRLERTELAQPAIFAVQVALTELWRSWGLEPGLVLGHSVGEVAAAWAAGALGLEQAARLALARGEQMGRVGTGGAMAEVGLPAAEVAPFLPAEVAIAAINSPDAVVLAGARAELEALEAALAPRGAGWRWLRVAYAFHSAQMDPILEPLERSLAFLAPQPGERPMISTVTGARCEGPELDAAYWRANVRDSVRFAAAVEAALEEGFEHFVEIGPHSVLSGSTLEILRSRGKNGGRVLPSMKREADGPATIYASAGRLFVLGYELELAEIGRRAGRRVALPGQVWERQDYWVDAAPEGRAAGTALDAAEAGALPGTPLAVAVPDGPIVWQFQLDLESLPFLADHRVRDLVVFPGTGYLSLLHQALSSLAPGRRVVIDSLRLERALVLEPGEGRRVQLALTPEGVEAGELRISSCELRDGAEWACHATGAYFFEDAVAAPSGGDEPPPFALPVEGSSKAEHYSRMERVGLAYGPSFQVVESLNLEAEAARGRLRLGLPEGQAGEPWRVATTLLDGALQMLESLLLASRGEGATHPYLPVGFGAVRLLSDLAATAEVRVQLLPGEDARGRRRRAELSLVDRSGRPLATLAEVTLERLGNEAADTAAAPLWQLTWEEVAELPQPLPARGAHHWLLFGDSQGFAQGLAAELAQHGRTAELVAAGPQGLASLEAALGKAQPALEGVAFARGLDLVEPLAGRDVDWQAAAEVYAELAQVVARLADAPGELSPRLAVVTAGASLATEGEPAFVQAPLLGLARTVAVEQPRIPLLRLDIGSLSGPRRAGWICGALLGEPIEDELAVQSGSLVAPRLSPEPPSSQGRVSRLPSGRAESQPFRLVALEAGQLSNLAFRPLERQCPGPGQVEIAVRAAGLNFRDVLKALGLYPGLEGDAVPLGDECAGVVTAVGEGVESPAVGDEVVAIADLSFATHTVAEAELAFPRPLRLSFEQAASVPIAFLTAHYALSEVGRLQAGERVLIHAAAGGVGLAAVQLARRLGAEIFATAGSEVKRQYLRSLGVPHVFDSRSLAFAREVREASGGRGVDVVLNSLSGDFLRESVKLLAPFGRFLEIGKRDIYENRRLGLYGLRQNASWAAIDADLLFRERPAEARRLLAEVLGLLDAGELEPLPIEIFPVDQAEGAFHHMAQARHLGKVVLSLAEADRTPLLPRAGESLHRSACYLLTGGLGGIGLALAEHMVRQEGARHLVLVGRSAASPVAAERLAALTALGARIDTAKVDVADRAAVAKLVERLRRAGAKVRGVVHAAGVLDDGVLGSLDAGRFRRVLLPKMAGAFHLASALEGEPLDFFLLCSSVTSMLGSAGQGNYAAANAGLDALAERLRRAGLPALSVAWGPWQGVGMTQTGDAEAQLARRGLAPIPLEAALAAFRSVLYRPEAQLGVGEWNLERFAEVHQLGAAASLFRGASKPRTPSTQSRSPFAELAAGDPRLLREKVAGYLRGLVGEVLRLEAGRVDAETPLRSQGLDSLMTVELRNRLEEGLGMRLSSSLIWNYPTVTALADHLGAVIEERWGAPSATAEPAEAALASQAEEALLSLSDDDAEAMLIQELESLDY